MFRGRLLWFWVCVAPVALLTALATVGDTFEIAWRLWFVSGPLLLVYGVLLWRGFAPQPTPAPSGPVSSVIERLIGVLVIMVLTISALGVLIAFVMWAKWYLLIASPVWLAFGAWIGWGLWQDRRKAKAAAQAKAPTVVRGAGRVMAARWCVEA